MCIICTCLSCLHIPIDMYIHIRAYEKAQRAYMYKDPLVCVLHIHNKGLYIMWLYVCKSVYDMCITYFTCTQNYTCAKE